MNALFPLAMSEEARLLTAIAIGALFGLALERGGFGNARKLVGQFYLHDMTVFKVMFTAIIVAMSGLFTLAQFGLVDLAAIWINPTFMWSQIVGGFLLGIGFIMSGLCPGTSVVSAASGRIDAWVTFGGVFFGTLLFTLLVDWLPALERLYHAGSMGTSLLPDLLGLPAPVVVLLVAGIAAAGFIGAEIVERIFKAKHAEREVELTPVTRPRMKLAVAGAVALLALIGVGAINRHAAQPQPIALASIDPLTVARRIIAGDPNLVVLDVRAAATKTVPGAAIAKLDPTGRALLEGKSPQTTVVVYDGDGRVRAVPGSWPHDLQYRYMSGGYAGWQQNVLTPAQPKSPALDEMSQVRAQNQIAAYFSGATTLAAPVAAPPPTAGGGGPKKKKAGGC